VAKDFSSSLCVQTSSKDHPNSYLMGNGVLSPRVKRVRARGWPLTPIKWRSPEWGGATSSLPSRAWMACIKQLYFTLLRITGKHDTQDN